MAEFAPEGTHLVNTTTAGDQVDPQVALLPGGGHVVAWTESGSSPGVVAQVYDASGAKAGGEVVLLQGYSLGDIAALADGTLVATVTQSTYDPNSGPHTGAYVARFDTSGDVLMAPKLLATGDYDASVAGGAAFALPGGGYATLVSSTTRPTPLSWITDSIQPFDAANTPVGTAFTADGTYAPQHDLAVMQSGAFVVTDYPQTGPGPSRMDWRVVDANGQPVSSESFASTYFQTNYGLATAVALADGRALVVWSLGSSNGSSYQTTWQGQWIDASGHPSGGVFAWDFSGDSAWRMTALATGGFLVTWSHSDDGIHYEVEVQAFDASAHAASSVMHLLPTAYSTASYEITATPDGGFLFDYQAASDGQDVFEEKFDAVPDSSGGSTPGSMHVNGGPVAVPPGSYSIVGGAGIDTISFAGTHTQYSVTPTSVSGPEGTDTLSGIERIDFADGYAIALDVNGDAGEAYRLYQAAFHRAPDLPGLGYHIHDLDNGVPLWLVAQHFIDSPEFQSTYGATDDTQFITLLYSNVLHRAPDAGGLQFHLDEFAHGESRADMLCHFSESPENQANVIGQIGDGMLYVPLG